MDDLVQRLRNQGPVNYVGDGIKELTDEAAAEIERLRADFNDCNAERVRWRSEAERLRAELAAERKWTRALNK